MADALTTLTSAAVAAYRARTSPDYQLDLWYDLAWSADAVLQEAQNLSLLIPDRHPAIEEASKELLAGDLAPLASREGELDPMLLHPGGGARLSADILAAGLFSSAFRQMFFLRLPADEGTYVRTVLEAYDELCRAIRGDQVRAHIISGIAGITLPEGAQVTTPWGVLRSAPTAPPNRPFAFPLRPQATCILAEPRLIPAVFDRAPEPKHDFDPMVVTPERARTLLPLACALASNPAEVPAGASVVWTTVLIPFQGASFGYSSPGLQPHMASTTDFGTRIGDLERWSRLVDASHSSTVDVAARRLVSAIAYRMDKSDSLIDAVMVWENVVGTSTELTFRVTAALAKLLESNPAERRALRKKLGDIYGLRSRVVHGDAVDPSAVSESATRAIDVAVQTLRRSYDRGLPWLSLSSSERADILLLEEP